MSYSIVRAVRNAANLPFLADSLRAKSVERRTRKLYAAAAQTVLGPVQPIPSREELQTVLENWQQRMGRTERGGKRKGRPITVEDYVRVRPISQEDEQELRELEEPCEARR